MPFKGCYKRNNTPATDEEHKTCFSKKKKNKKTVKNLFCKFICLLLLLVFASNSLAQNTTNIIGCRLFHLSIFFTANKFTFTYGSSSEATQQATSCIYITYMPIYLPHYNSPTYVNARLANE